MGKLEALLLTRARGTLRGKRISSSSRGTDMAGHENSSKRSLTKSGRARRRFLEGTALAAAGTSAALVPGLRAAAAQSPAGAAPMNCPTVPTPMKDVEGKVAFITGGNSG